MASCAYLIGASIYQLKMSRVVEWVCCCFDSWVFSLLKEGLRVGGVVGC